VYAAASQGSSSAPTHHTIRRAGITVTTHTVDLAQRPADLLGTVTALAARIAMFCPHEGRAYTNSNSHPPTDTDT
jgi:hypothetical protein